MVIVKEKAAKFKDKKILVVGLARSGAGAANLLLSLGADVTVTDSRPGDALRYHINNLMPGIHVVAGDNPPGLFEAADLIVISPGVSLNSAPLRLAKAKGVPVIGELELAYQTVAGPRLRITDGQQHEDVTRGTGPSTPHFIGITGTNGKSTVTTLVDLMLRESGLQTILGGNIGIALTEELLKRGPGSGRPQPDYIVAEISSFQLETISEFKPRIASILNITPDHLDRYDSISEYISAKARLFENQSRDDYLVMNADDPLVMEMLKQGQDKRAEAMPRTVYFSSRREVEGIYAKNGTLYLNLPYIEPSVPHLPLISGDEIGIKGVHNLENAMAASLISMLAGCSAHAVISVLRGFRGLEHRLEHVADINGVSFINDSKGTNTGAVAKSLESFENLILIMGGLDKGGDFSGLRELVRKKVKLLLLMGSAREKIAGALEGTAEMALVKDLNEAVALSAARASEGDTVLLSPGCASFDMFKDFEERGRKFKEAVRRLLK